MSQVPVVVDQYHNRIPLDTRLGSGGEGAVYSLEKNRDLVAKIYHKPLAAEQVDKLQIMVRLASPDLLTLAAWPRTLLFDGRTNALAGFLMPRLQDCHPLQMLYNPFQRMKTFPKASWQFQIRAARNLAACFDEVHKSGCLVGDINQGNAMVTSQALVRLIDCDSFQLSQNGRTFLCEVGVAHYTPPELQGKSFRGLVRTQNHDRFGLAVLIYQLLFTGRHPYAGLHEDEATAEQLIATYRFSQGPNAHLWRMKPPPHCPLFSDISPELGVLFRLAFERGTGTNPRPAPAQWMRELQRFEESLCECHVDSGHRYWSQAKECVWCRIFNQGGPEYYFGVAARGDTFDVDEKRLQDILNRLEKAEILEFPVPKSAVPGAVSDDCGKPVPEEIGLLREQLTAAQATISRVDADRELALHELDHQQTLAMESFKEEVRLEIRPLKRRVISCERAVLEEHTRWRIPSSWQAWLGYGQRRSRNLFTVLGISQLLIMILQYWMALFVLDLVAVIFVGCLYLRRKLARSDKEIQLDDARQQLNALLVRMKVRRRQIELNANQARKEELLVWNSLRSEAVADADSAATIYRLEVEHERNNRIERRTGILRQISQIDRTWSQELAEFESEFRITTGMVRQQCGNCHALLTKYKSELEKLLVRSDEEGRDRYLRLHSIEDAQIPGIGPERISRLEAWGIITAADIDPHKILQIPGFGDALTDRLLAWKRGIEGQYQPAGRSGISPSAAQGLAEKYHRWLRQYLTEMGQYVVAIENHSAISRSTLMRLKGERETKLNELAHADADLRRFEQSC